MIKVSSVLVINGIAVETTMNNLAQPLSYVQLFMTPWTIAHQAPLSVGFPRQEYWSGLLFPSLGDLPNPGIEPTMSPAMAGGFFTAGLATGITKFQI